MAIWAIADLHLSFGIPDKSMTFFGEPWIGYTDKIESYWHAHIKPDDLILIPGDISWAMHVKDAVPDLEWIHSLPGTKVFLKGNHDYWWTSLTQIEKVLPKSIHLIQNNSFHWHDVAIGGVRLWDTPEYNFNAYVHYVDNPRAKVLTSNDSKKPDNEKIFARELCRLEMSLNSMHPSSQKRIAMTHYPPIGADLNPSRTSALLEKFHIDTCVFGHLHNLSPVPSFGEKNGVRYILTSCDCIDFKAVKLFS